MSEPKQKLFLSARWENLILITYAVKPDILSSYLPNGLEPDTLNQNAFISLVAFEFLDTRVKGMKIPFHINFPEINLRFYVENNGKRGVVFIKELVPKFFIACTANMLYNENYKCVRMANTSEKNSKIIVNHKIHFHGDDFTISASGDNNPYMPSKDSLEHFFKEHEWGFGKSRKGNTLVYRVEHPHWNIYPVEDISLDFDFGKVYGSKWEFLNSEKPFNITFAEGSGVKVYSPKIL